MARVVGKTRFNASGIPTAIHPSGDLRLNDTRCDSHSRRYVKSFVRGCRCGITAARSSCLKFCECYRRRRPTYGSQLALWAAYRYHGFITDRAGDTLALEADHRRHAEIENAIRDLKYGSGSTISPQVASQPTPPGWRSRSCPVLDTGSWPTTWHAGQRASAWASR